MSLFNELKRRNVIKVSIAYIVVAWLIMQVTDVVLNNIEAPGWVFQVIMLLLAIGFPLIALFAWAFELTPDGIKREHEIDRSQSIAPKTGRKLDFVIMAVMALALGYFAYDKFIVSPEPSVATDATTAQTISQPETTVVIEDPEKSIAVLPFVNMSSDPEQEYFADGISEELLNALAQVNGLKVAGRTSSFAFKGKNDDLNAIGKLLRVNHILEGSVRKSGTRIRITAQLIKVDDGFHMWSETYDRELNDIFAIQDEITAAILVELKTQLLNDQSLQVTQTDTRAYELYLLAKQRIYERNDASLQMAETLLSEAIEIDPDYAPAFAQLGIANILISDRNYGTVPTLQAHHRAKLNLDKALQLTPQNAEALAGMGLYYRQTGAHQKAVTTLRQALVINPSMVNANSWLANSFDSSGRLQEALQIREQTFLRDPLHKPTFVNLAQKYTVLGQSKKALDMLDRLKSYLPGDATLTSAYGQLYLMTGELANARNYLQLAVQKEPLNVVNPLWLGFVYFGSRQYEEMIGVTPDILSVLGLSRLDRMEEATILGEQAIGKGLNPDFYFQALAESGRFAQLIETMESHWIDLDGFSTNWPGTGGFGYDAMGFLAQAYLQLGRLAEFDDAMLRFKTSLDTQVANGADNWVLNVSRAHYAGLANDYDTAISLLEKSFTQGFYIDTVSKIAWPVFKPLDGDPRYEAAKVKMVARLNTERKKMGLEAVES
jgi:TolB-like protein/Flp pilus assembly protein TadD